MFTAIVYFSIGNSDQPDQAPVIVSANLPPLPDQLDPAEQSASSSAAAEMLQQQPEHEVAGEEFDDAEVEEIAPSEPTATDEQLCDSAEDLLYPHAVTVDALPLYGPDSPYTIHRGKMTGPLGVSIDEMGLDGRLTGDIVHALTDVYDFRTCRLGEKFSVVLDRDGQLVHFNYDKNALEGYRVYRNDDGELIGERKDTNIERRIVGMSGVVRDFLFNSVYELGETPALIVDLAMVFAWDIDFSLMTRVGDSYKLIVEKLYQYGKFVGYGRILAASYTGYFGTRTAVFYEIDDKTADYFTPDGNALRKAFLRAPLRFDRISSAFSRSRMHPVLGVRRPHSGVDYAAPTGTPVWAVSDGTVMAHGFDHGGGKYVKIRHPNGWVTTYMHLSRFSRGLSNGQHVGQKQVIGYVGRTGYATGPHLDFRIKIGERYVNPLTVEYPPGDPIPEEKMKLFFSYAEKMQELLQMIEPAYLETESNTAVGISRRMEFPKLPTEG